MDKRNKGFFGSALFLWTGGGPCLSDCFFFVTVFLYSGEEQLLFTKARESYSESSHLDDLENSEQTNRHLCEQAHDAHTCVWNADALSHFPTLTTCKTFP